MKKGIIVSFAFIFVFSFAKVTYALLSADDQSLTQVVSPTSVAITPPLNVTSTGTIYYVDSLYGSDSNNGTSQQTPWKTVAKVNNSNFYPGDQILFKRGGNWREQLIVPSSGAMNHPVTFDAYGSGPAPIISGSNIVTGWSRYNGNIFVSNVGSIGSPTQLYVDGTFYDIAHYPNSGYLPATSNSSDLTSIIDTNLNLTSGQIVGAAVVDRAVSWRLTTNVATAYDPTAHKITLSGSVYGTTKMATGNGFYLQNMLWMLDSPGEWYYDSAAGKLYLWTASSDDPTNHKVEISARSFGVQVSGKSFVTIQNLNIVNATSYDVSLSVTDNINLNNLTISGGNVGINGKSLTSSTIQNSSITNTLSDSLQIYGGANSNLLISNNKLNNAGMVGTTPKGVLGALTLDYANLTTINGNTITNSSYNGITAYGNQLTIQNNSINQSCLTLVDCAGIYTYNLNVAANSGISTIIGNTVQNTIGNFNGLNSNYSSVPAAGIYLDDLSNMYNVSNNIVYNAAFGIFIHSGYNNNITNNSVYASRIQALELTESGSYAGEKAGASYNNVIKGNILESIANTSTFYNGNGTAVYYSAFGSTAGFGAYDNNQYCHPYLNYVISNKNTPGSVTNYTLSTWRVFSNQDLHSTDSTSFCPRPSFLPPAPAPIPLAITSFNANPTSVTSGQPVVLSWTSTGATSCSIPDSAGGGTSGSTIVYPTVSTTYTQTCNDSSGHSVSKSVSVSVSQGTPGGGSGQFVPLSLLPTDRQTQMASIIQGFKDLLNAIIDYLKGQQP